LSLSVLLLSVARERERERERERQSFIRNNLHNGVVSGAARGQALLGPMWAGRRELEMRFIEISRSPGTPETSVLPGT
jgi:hypothetical protein